MPLGTAERFLAAAVSDSQAGVVDVLEDKRRLAYVDGRIPHFSSTSTIMNNNNYYSYRRDKVYQSPMPVLMFYSRQGENVFMSALFEWLSQRSDKMYIT